MGKWKEEELNRFPFSLTLFPFNKPFSSEAIQPAVLGADDDAASADGWGCGERRSSIKLPELCAGVETQYVKTPVIRTHEDAPGRNGRR